MLTFLNQAFEWLQSENFGANAVRVALLLIVGVTFAFLVKGLLSFILSKSLRFIAARRSDSWFESPRARRIATVSLPRVAFWFIIIFSLTLVIQNLAGLPLLETWAQVAAEYLPKVFTAILLLLGGAWGGVVLKETIARVGSAGGLPYARALGALAQGATVFTAVIIAVHQLGVDLSFLTILAGVTLGCVLLGASLAFGLGAQYMVSNIMASHYIQKIFRVGSLVEINGHRGVIVEMAGPFVIIESKDGQVSIPAREFSRSAAKQIDAQKDTP
ncbi:MAG: mechanosensitive ion channel domain-containing protein [Verrucomicrobiota bacterium]